MRCVTSTTRPKAQPRPRKPRASRWPLAWDGDRLVTTTDEATAAVDRARLSASTAKAVNSCPARMVADRLMRGPEDPLDPAPLGTAAHTVLERLFTLTALRCAAGRVNSRSSTVWAAVPSGAGSSGNWRPRT